MMKESIPVTLKILGKEYKIACNIDEREDLLTSAQLLDAEMRELRDSGKVIGPDRIAVMAALNLAHDLRQSQKQNEILSKGMGDRLTHLRQKIENILENF
jgi:cell division protein ZapA